MISDFPGSLALAHQFETRVGHLCCLLLLDCPEDQLVARLSGADLPEKHFQGESLE